jgi:hypothetical protein
MSKKIQGFIEFNEKLDTTDFRQQFIDLIGEDNIKHIEKYNQVEYGSSPISGNDLEIKFFETDGKGDRVIHFTIAYNFDDKVIYSENCIDSQPIGYSTYEEMRDHVLEIEDRIINNGFNLPNLP